MSSITVQSPAKINLFLHITGKRADGYHNLQTVFRLIDMYDTLTFTITNQPNLGKLPIILTTNNAITDNPNDNLIMKAGLALLDFAKQQRNVDESFIQQLSVIHIDLQKHIPMGAGLGGGSSNCATTLKKLNEIWQLNFSSEQLQQIGAKLGADVPIFIVGQDAIAEGIGEILTPIDLPKQRFLLVMPNVHINTKQLFENKQLKRDCTPFTLDFLQKNIELFTDILNENFYNVFQPVVTNLSPDINHYLQQLFNFAKITQTTPRMTGSGSCLFLPLPMTVEEQQIGEWQTKIVCPSKVVMTL